jgi:hypothetical protein
MRFYFFKKLIHDLILKSHISIVYYSIFDMNSEFIQNVTYDNYDDFQHDNFIFSQIFISLF